MTACPMTGIAAQASAPDSKKKTVEQEKEVKGSDHIGGQMPQAACPSFFLVIESEGKGAIL